MKDPGKTRRYEATLPAATVVQVLDGWGMASGARFTPQRYFRLPNPKAPAMRHKKNGHVKT